MDPDWPRNPPSSIICVLCKSVMPFSDRNPERFFRHLIADHCTYFNLNLLLDISLLQPRFQDFTNRKEAEVPPNDVEDVEDGDLHKKVIKKEVNSIQMEDQYEDSERDNVYGENMDSDSCNSNDSSDSRDLIRNIISPIVNSVGSPNSGSGFVPANEDEPSNESEVGMVHEVNNEEEDFDMSLFFKNLPQHQYDPDQPSIDDGSQVQPTRISDGLKESGKKRYPSAPAFFIPTVPSIQTDISALDPISIVKKEPRARRASQPLKVPLFDQDADQLPSNPNRHLVPEDLQRLIVQGNPSRAVKFTLSQRQNTQMVLNDYVLKKKKGPYSARGRRVINWKCVNDLCPYTCVTCESQILEKSKFHNHDPRPELYIKKQARVKIRESIHNEIESNYYVDRAVSNHVYDIVNETDDHDREKIGSIDALKQAARRFNRKLLNKESKGTKPSPLKQMLNPNINVNTDDYSIVSQMPDNVEIEMNELELNAHYICIENLKDFSEAHLTDMKNNELDNNIDSASNKASEDNIEELLKASPYKTEFVADELLNDC